MSQLDEAWNDVGEQFKKLGSVFKEHYDEYGVDEAVDVSDEAFEDAMRSLGEGLRAAVGAVGDSIKDPELATDVRDTAGSLFTALGATFSEIGSQISTHEEDASSPDEGADQVAEAASTTPSEPDDGEDTDEA